MKRRKHDAYDGNFTSIASRYDLMKVILSGGQEPRWKGALFRSCIGDVPERWVDVATGTGEFFRLANGSRETVMIGIDRNREMLKIARAKNYHHQIRWILGDLNELPFADESVDLITVGYGLRYCGDIEGFARACFGLLRPGGKVFTFDVGHPSPLLRPLWYAYLISAGTILGTVLHGNPRTYWHLWQTLREFPGQAEVSRVFQLAGFPKVSCTNILNGMMYGHCAEKSR